jgi:hypothetical protein
MPHVCLPMMRALDPWAVDSYFMMSCCLPASLPRNLSLALVYLLAPPTSPCCWSAAAEAAPEAIAVLSVSLMPLTYRTRCQCRRNSLEVHDCWKKQTQRKASTHDCIYNPHAKAVMHMFSSASSSDKPPRLLLACRCVDSIHRRRDASSSLVKLKRAGFSAATSTAELSSFSCGKTHSGHGWHSEGSCFVRTPA